MENGAKRSPKSTPQEKSASDYQATSFTDVLSYRSSVQQYRLAPRVIDRYLTKPRLQEIACGPAEPNQPDNAICSRDRDAWLMPLRTK
jgi:hypothetical protein